MNAAVTRDKLKVWLNCGCTGYSCIPPYEPEAQAHQLSAFMASNISNDLLAENIRLIGGRRGHLKSPRSAAVWIRSATASLRRGDLETT